MDSRGRRRFRFRRIAERDDLDQLIEEQLAQPIAIRPGEELRLGFDGERREWMAHYAVADMTEMTFGLGLHSFNDYEQAIQSALELVAGGCPMIADPHIARSALEPTVFVDHGQWQLWIPCSDCLGFSISLGLEDDGRSCWPARIRAEAYVQTAAICTGCVSQQIRQGEIVSDGEPAIWFDVDSGAWHLWQPFTGSDEGVSLPLEVGGGFFADPSELRRAASQMLVGG